ncbi:histidinol-phosphatase (PHP family) [Metabacillus crassostreae]|uniref:histidinol-phosphatase HisJ n=1 Tax=Metabacillus crassostreae TaxID=929098 RepID=UPI00195EDDC5|nr:histidinol-phosphatase HisJ [Metabacillus crassostreae]MBM7605615.1 histidinol-phosphatase (PHP family) [Metabacillus crassostreae]
MLKIDGHVHSPYCPHGTTDLLEEYVEKAIIEGFQSLSFTEHAPLPIGFTDPTPMKDSAMKLEDLEEYIEKVQIVKNKYHNKIAINLGLEVDYIKDFENETTKFLNKYGKYLDDSILSVHFLNIKNSYYCLDFDENTFGEMVQLSGSLQKLHQLYYDEVLHSVNSYLGTYKPNRIGHLTLVNKFQKLYPITFSMEKTILHILQAIKDQGMEIDYNVAGLRKEFCGEAYPGPTIIQLAKKQKIPLIYGSDAHCARDVGKNYSYFYSLT